MRREYLFILVLSIAGLDKSIKPKESNTDHLHLCVKTVTEWWNNCPQFLWMAIIRFAILFLYFERRDTNWSHDYTCLLFTIGKWCMGLIVSPRPQIVMDDRKNNNGTRRSIHFHPILIWFYKVLYPKEIIAFSRDCLTWFTFILFIHFPLSHNYCAILLWKKGQKMEPLNI